MAQSEEHSIDWDRWRAALAWHLEATGESRKSFATRAKIPTSTLYGWLSGNSKHHRLGFELVRKIELAVGVDLDTLSQQYAVSRRTQRDQGQTPQGISLVAFEQSTEQRVRLLTDVVMHILRQVSNDKDYIRHTEDTLRKLDDDGADPDDDPAQGSANLDGGTHRHGRS